MRRLLAFLFLITFSHPCFAEKSDLPPSASLARLIHDRRGNWIALKGDLSLEFLTAQGGKVTCRSELAYQRLDEKILLKGFNEKKELLFAFKSLDRGFELYLPLLAEDYKGSIFDLEDSPEIQSHLRVLDLYRALKPGALPIERMNAAAAKNGNFQIQIKRGKSNPQLSRELEASPKGDVLREVFYSAEGTPGTEIQRSEFKEIKDRSYSKTIFPHRIEIISYSSPAGAGPKKTVLTFHRLDLLSEISDSTFELPVPETTKRIHLE